MPALTRLAQQIDGTPGDDFPPVTQERFQHFLQVEGARLTIDQRHDVDTEHALELRLRVEVVQHHLAGLATTQLDDHAQAVLVGFIAQLADAFDTLLLDQLRDLLDQARLVELVGNLRNDDGFAPLLSSTMTSARART